MLDAVPPRYRSRLVDLKNALWGGYRKIHYSQSGEDVILAALLRQDAGFYVDVGANHPKRYSNTALLYQQGWRGINIDPNPYSIALFNHARPRDINIAAGVARTKGLLPFYQFSDPAYNTFSKQVADALKEKRWLRMLSDAPMPVLPLVSILEEHLPHGQHIDVMNIDVEGLDLEVLESNDWERFAPTYIAIEAHGFTPGAPTSHPVYEFLTRRGYVLRAFTGLTLIFSKL